MTSLRTYRVWNIDNWEKYPNHGGPQTLVSHELCFPEGDWGASAGPMEDDSTPSEVCYYCKKEVFEQEGPGTRRVMRSPEEIWSLITEIDVIFDGLLESAAYSSDEQLRHRIDKNDCAGDTLIWVLGDISTEELRTDLEIERLKGLVA